MIRRWLVRPDHVVGDTPAVSQEALIKAAMDGAILVDRCGGHFALSADRAPTGVPGERVTTIAMAVWKDRTDAREAPEQSAELVTPFDAGIDAMPEEDEHPGDLPEAAVSVNAAGEEVDESDVPLELRG